ncbi:MAG TPA: peptide ABC transporter ATP-binding protein [Firmicutes bacterium]|nr:peptide ABC transporter ATP-binding protein [Bacillota bacterium]HAW71955.1 peptide ABC transporter ATP-binding protein [Bacillota bacterium]HAZ22507.1 peptide ABC transporter ATP-binding protein [Bacillota bacterium]HBE04955.1 peptide ABC transporter ATP-binding protein [Bacillota bacterium]HBG44957.1 peptide ABC transporter ATP-binding protein [Bacillota bacterium]
MSEQQQQLLSVRNLKTHYFTPDGVVKAVDGVDFDINRGKILGIVGESGCGKSQSVLSIMGLIPKPPGKIVDGQILFEGKDLVRATEAEMRAIRGNDISMIFQEPMTSLNPVFTIGNQIMEAIMLHQKLNKHDAKAKAIEMLELVGIPAPDKRVDEYPHQLSGGMRQRVMIAMALSCNPKLLIADEPTTALDVTIQAQILDLMKKLQNDIGMAIALITHDLGVIAEVVERVVVMYAGKIVEEAPVGELFARPLHPYTLGLLGSIPAIDKKTERLKVIPGIVPNPMNLPPGCRFNPRCEYVMDICREQEPEIRKIGPDHSVRCWLREK